MFDLIKKMISVGAGLAVMTAEKIEEAVNEMVRKGHISEKEGKQLFEFLLKQSKKVKADFGERITRVISDTFPRLNIPTRKEIEELKKRIENLEKASEKAGRDERSLLE